MAASSAADEEKHDNAGQDDQRNRMAGGEQAVSRKRRWSAPPDCSTSDTPTVTTTGRHGNVSSVSNKILAVASVVASKSK